MGRNLSKYALIFLVLALSGVLFFLRNIQTLEVRKDPAFMLLDRQKEGGSREVMLLLLIKLNLLLLLCGATSLNPLIPIAAADGMLEFPHSGRGRP